MHIYDKENKHSNCITNTDPCLWQSSKPFSIQYMVQYSIYTVYGIYIMYCIYICIMLLICIYSFHIFIIIIINFIYYCNIMVQNWG